MGHKVNLVSQFLLTFFMPDDLGEYINYLYVLIYSICPINIFNM